MNNEVKNAIDEAIQSHVHDGNFAQRVNTFDLFGETAAAIPAYPATIATTGNTDAYIIAPINGSLSFAYFSGVDALAANNTNYITFTITNLGQAGAGTTVMLKAADSNTTKATGGTALGANTLRSLVLSTSPNDLQVVEGDRLLIRAAVTNTLANTVTFPTFLLLFN